jgi:hypothetical protein
MEMDQRFRLRQRGWAMIAEGHRHLALAHEGDTAHAHRQESIIASNYAYFYEQVLAGYLVGLPPPEYTMSRYREFARIDIARADGTRSSLCCGTFQHYCAALKSFLYEIETAGGELTVLMPTAEDGWEPIVTHYRDEGGHILTRRAEQQAKR